MVTFFKVREGSPSQAHHQVLCVRTSPHVHTYPLGSSRGPLRATHNSPILNRQPLGRSQGLRPLLPAV
jgi:hypothetical protein